MITTQRIFILQKLKKNLLNLILPFIKYSYNTDRNVYVYTDKFEKKKKRVEIQIFEKIFAKINDYGLGSAWGEGSKGFRLNCSKLCGGRHPEGFQRRRVLDAIITTRGHVSGFLEEKSTPRFSTCVSRRTRARAHTCPSRERFNWRDRHFGFLPSRFSRSFDSFERNNIWSTFVVEKYVYFVYLA